MGKMNIEIFYVVPLFMSKEIISEDWKAIRYGPDRNQGHLFFVCLVGEAYQGNKGWRKFDCDE